MKDFTYYNPVRVVFGKKSVKKLSKLIPPSSKIMLTYGTGSIKKNGVYDDILSELSGFEVIEFGGIKPNPDYETLMKAVETAKKSGVDFILAAGGGSVIDGTKFIAAAIPFEGDPWDILARGAKVRSAVPFGSVLTIPATGSEMNNGAVISKIETSEKLVFKSEHVYPEFSIMNPEYTYSLPWDQTANGIVDAFVHVVEQYLTYDVGATLQYYEAEAVFKTLTEAARKVQSAPEDYNARADIMWSATHALNGNLRCGTVEDWSTHLIGHELTALFGMAHARSLAAVLPALLRYKKSSKLKMLVRLAENVWGISEGDENEKAERAINKTAEFFESLGVPANLGFYSPDPEKLRIIPARFEKRGFNLGEHRDITPAAVSEILELALKS